ncbi:MAG: SIMPL domain-containing protein [bacterium]|nr:SIMPL domain-containing protein [bacterium]
MRFLPNFQQSAPLQPRSLVAIATMAAVALLVLCQPKPLHAHDGDHDEAKAARTLTLSATGSISSRPDMANISTGVTSEAVKARDALDDNNDAMARMMKSLKAAGLESRDIATSQFSVQPRYQHFKNGRAARIIGYRVSNSVRITVRNLNQLGTILDRMVTVGSNRISGIQFGLQDPDKTLNDARKDAMRAVLDKAALYARAADVRLGDIVSISEQANRNFPRPMKMRSMRAKSSVPIAPGQHTSKVTVHVKWSLTE